MQNVYIGKQYSTPFESAGSTAPCAILMQLSFLPRKDHVVAFIELQPQDIAPCGVNCQACSAYLDSKKPCHGCRVPDTLITRKSCKNCKKRNCAFEKGLTWCFECESFPCVHIKSLNKRYQKCYNINLISNGVCAREDMDSFLEAQTKRFTCIFCGGTIDQHNQRCSICAQNEHL